MLDEIKKIADQVVIIGDAVLIQADCTLILPLIDKVDAVVTDPPFGIGQDKGFDGSGGFGKPIKRKKYTGQWDKVRPNNSIFEQIIMMKKPAIIWGGQYFADLLPANGKWLWWDKCQTMPTYGDGELAWTNLIGNAPKKIIYNNNGVMAKERGGLHPTQKPIGVMKWCISHLPDDAQTIFDPFMGSGSTGVAGVQMGKSFIGIERDAAYFDIAIKRIEQAQRQDDLFIEKPAKKQTETLF